MIHLKHLFFGVIKFHLGPMCIQITAMINITTHKILPINKYFINHRNQQSYVF